jgi:hypothetical protein
LGSGWKDSFASPRFTARQWDYARHNGRGEVATPQVWLNGRTTLVGSNARQLNAAIATSGPAAGAPIRVEGDRIAIGGGTVPAGGADIWLVRYDPRTVQVAIRAGENNGRTLPHRDIVRELTRIGRWNGTPQSLTLPRSAMPGLKSAILIQAGPGGEIVAAAKV